MRKTLENSNHVENLNLDMAVKCYIDRKARTAHPEGSFDSAGRWCPSKKEECIFCGLIRPPSRGFPYSVLTHCRTIEHIAQLFDVGGSELRKAVNAHKKSILIKSQIASTK